MRNVFLPVMLCVLLSSTCFAADRSIEMSTDLAAASAGDTINFKCTSVGEWELPMISAKIVIHDADGTRRIRKKMTISGSSATYDYTVPTDAQEGNWRFKCVISDRFNKVKESTTFPIIEKLIDHQPETDATTAHNSIYEYNGPATCVSCHQQEAEEMLDSLHMRWSGPTPKLTNTDGEELGKAVGGINTFCTYAMSSKGTCFSCHVRADGNAPHPPEKNDVDCLMCHSDSYQRKFVSDPDNTESVVNILGQEKTYVFGSVDTEGNYTTVPDFEKMNPGTTMVDIAKAVHLPTSKSCLRCHAKAGGGDWTKRGDMGLSSAAPPVEEDVHLSKSGAGLSCVNCHASSKHKISGRGIDLRQTEAEAPTCKACHSTSPHSDTTLNRHAAGQISCQVCHIREYAKGGATEISRDWLKPLWNPAFCSGQGGFVGEEIKESFVKPEYVWFDGTSYVYNLGEIIAPGENGVYQMAKAHGGPFDGNSAIFPVKRHTTIMPLLDDGRIIPPAIMWMFMTGDFDLAIQKGMQAQGMSGDYSIVDADAEMLITHGVEPKENAPTCAECHDGSGSTPDGIRMLPFESLGYHEIPQKILSCTLCHEQKNMQWQTMHQKHREDDISCNSCHTPEPTGFVEAKSSLCRSCHESKSWKNEGHKKHIEKGLECVSCHSFS